MTSMPQPSQPAPLHADSALAQSKTQDAGPRTQDEKPQTFPTDERNDFWHQHGYWIARGLIPAAEVSALREAAMTQSALGPVPGLWDEDFTKRHPVANDPLALHPRLLQVHRYLDQPIGKPALAQLLHPRVFTVVESLFDEPAFAAQSMIYFKPPGSRGQDFHQDNFYLSVMPGTCMAAWIALDRADAENGGLSVVPGSHRLDIICPETADLQSSFVADRTPIPPGLAPMQVELEPGDVLFFNGQVIHGSTPNRSADRWRRSLICHYLPQSSTAIHDWYQPLLDAAGSEHRIGTSVADGPCGAPLAAVPH